MTDDLVPLFLHILFPYIRICSLITMLGLYIENKIWFDLIWQLKLPKKTYYLAERPQ